MPKYTVDYLYNEFSQLAGMRSDSQYSNDAGYWTGGRCNWGGSHNLREDCGTLARGFEKMDSLDSKQLTDELTNTLSKGEFDTKKAILLQKINEITNGLQARTGHSSSMFGICIIWADHMMSPYIENKMQDCRRNLDALKNQLGGTNYQWVEELKRLELEIKKIEQRMKENKRKAMNEKDPIKKQALIEEIESDGRLLQQKYQEHQEHSNKFNFNASRHVSDIVEAIKRAIQRSNKGGGSGNGGGNGGSGGNRRNPNSDPNNPFGNLPDGDGNSPGNIPNNTPHSRNPSQTGDNQQLILVALATIALIFILMSQKDSESASSIAITNTTIMTNPQLEQAKHQLGQQTQNLEHKVSELWFEI